MAFQFARDVSLVSVSDDGISPPKLYEVGDLITSLNGIVRREPSPVVLLDDQPILPLLTNLTKGTVTHDLDAGWNALFTSIAKGSSGLTVADYLTLGAYSAYDFTSDISTLTLANGTKLQFRNVAIPNFDFRGVRDGNALHQAVEVNVATVADMLVKRNASTTPCRHPQHRDISKRQTLQNPYRFCRVPHGTSPRPRGYPVPVAEHADHHAGLFLPRSMPGVAVLQIASFSSLYAAVGRDPDCIEADVIEFHRFLLAAMRQLDAAAKALSNGTALKLVVDLQSNPGGFEATVGDVIAQLFPPASSDVATAPPKVRGFTWRARAHAALDWIGARLFSPGQESGTPLLYALHPVPSSQNESLKTFPSWPAFFGPEPLPSPDGASTRRGNSTYPSFRYVHRDRASIDMGATYFSASNPPFPDPASQILVLTDGDCHSACALLANWLVALGARSVALGGRPDTSQRAMELVGGTKGCTPLTYTALQTQSSRAMQVAGFSPAMSQAQRPAFLPAGAGVQPPIALADLTVNTADVFSGGYGDGITGGAVGSTPVQFISRKADCRLYYDREMLLDIEAVWRRAAEAIWASGSSGGKCAGAGSAAARRSMVEADAAKVDHLRRRADALGDVREVQRVSLWGERKGLGDGGLRSKDDIFRSLYMLG